MPKAYANPAHGYEPVVVEQNETEFAYTLFVQGTVLINWHDIVPLRKALDDLPSGRGTFIRYNETGLDEYDDYGPVAGEGQPKDLADEYDYDYH